MAKRQYIFSTGEPVPSNRCILPDNVRQTFKVSIRSLWGISPENLLRLIQTQYEVLGTPEEVDSVCVVRNKR